MYNYNNFIKDVLTVRNNTKDNFTHSPSYINEYKGKTFVIKYGGSIMEDENAKKCFFQDIAFLKKLGANLVIVHGGGKRISAMLKQIGCPVEFKRGLRVTDSKTMEIVELVLSGGVNKEISNALTLIGASALGISGKDAGLLKAKKTLAKVDNEYIDLGFVGEIVSVNTKVIEDIIKMGYIPVISPVSCDEDGNSYNVNADYAAASISSHLKADKLILLTDVPGVYSSFEDKTIIDEIYEDEVENYISSGIISGGMIPKITCCKDVVRLGVKDVIMIDGSRGHGLLLDALSEGGSKTVIRKGVRECQKVI
jgi:acetylglutamate kinase